MDGQRRIARPLGRRHWQAPLRVESWGNGLGVRTLIRSSAVLFLGLTLFHGLMQGGHLDYEGSPWIKAPDQISSLIGLAADDISITGLEHHEPQQVLDAIGVKPGASLVAFDAAEAQRRLQSLNWIAAASVQRSFPNRLEIALSERQPFAIWQQAGVFRVIDNQGVVMTGLDASNYGRLPLVTGEGANLAAAEYVNQMEAIPDLRVKVQAAARVGQRRWTLYLDNGVRIALPDRDVQAALDRVAQLDATQDLLSKGIREIDLRVQGRLVIQVAEAIDAEGEAKVKLSQSQ